MSKKTPKPVNFCLIIWVFKRRHWKSQHRKASRESHSTSTQSSPAPYPHPSTEIGHAQNISLSQRFNQRASGSRNSALKLTCRKASRCLFLGFLLASSSLSWVLPAPRVAYPSPLPCHLSNVKSLHSSNSSSRSYSFFIEGYPWVKWQIPGQVRTSTHESYCIAPWSKYLW